MNALEQELYALTERRDIIAGCCDALPMLSAGPPIEAAPFVNFAPAERVTPRLCMPSAQSLIFVGLGYGAREAFTLDAAPRGRISVSMTGPDYHGTMRSLLTRLAEGLERAAAGGLPSGLPPIREYKIFVDTGPLDERKFAQKAGLGVIGAHGCVISQKLGSFFHIGYIMTNIHPENLSAFIPAKPPETQGCAGCGKCARVCPGDALGSRTPIFDYKRCVSYLTQCKGELKEGEKRIMGDWVFGCDLCQNACPMNRGKYLGTIDNAEETRPKLSDLLNLTNAGFKARFAGTAAGWRGKKILQRNAAIVLENLRA